ncbi:MAG: flagellar regulator YcgR PilZN domain-containing protein [Sutterellaceae bacterium]|nr:flagellar brake protein [Burkholderiaceae bacterium]MCX7901998.1 flagellar brake protein [Burkholderiaceae bacterium]MDW8430893.1 flagellar regulator YcgR PilZN domain-containing protein [Sutterellaceae bacterium]
MGMTTPYPEPDSPELERFNVYAKVEIVSLLKQLSEEGVLMTAYFDAEPGFAVTMVLAVNADFEEVIFDAAADALAHKRLLASRHIVFVGFLDHVKVQFVAHLAEATQYQSRPAFRVRLPDSVLRLQRRDFFRVRPPLSKPAKCLVPHCEDSKQYEALRVLDLSVGGLAVLTYPEKFELPVGRVIEHCYLDLPGVGSITVSLHVRHVDPLPKDDKARRCGCEFVDMPPAARVTLQRYINQVDAENRKVAAIKRVA